MEFRPVEPEEQKTVTEVYARARRLMAERNNPGQWGKQYPGPEQIQSDLAQGALYALWDEDRMMAVFAILTGEDPTYRVIEDGAWLNDRPYATVHRIAVAEDGRGAAGQCLQWCVKQYGNVRVDTHADNAAMRHVLEKNGFTYCGRIYVADGSPRLAYQRDDT